MTMITDLSLDLVEEILSKVPLTSLKSVKSTCKGWNTLFKDERFSKKHCGKSAKEFPMFLTCDYYSFKRRFNLHGIHDIKDLPCIKEIGKLHSPIGLHIINHCDGLLLCLSKDEANRLVVWNPYMAQTRWIELRNKRSQLDLYALGYDNNKNHKVLLLTYDDIYLKREIYDFKSSSWRVLNIIYPKRIRKRGVSLKGNSYFVVDGKLLGFDFTREKFGPRMDLPFNTDYISEIPYSCVRGEQLALLYQRNLYELVIWITTEVQPDTVSWSNLFKVDTKPVFGSDHGFLVRSFFLIDKEKKVAVACGGYQYLRRNFYEDDCYVVGEHGCYQVNLTHMKDLLISYIPSSVRVQ